MYLHDDHLEIKLVVLYCIIQCAMIMLILPIIVNKFHKAKIPYIKTLLGDHEQATTNTMSTASLATLPQPLIK